MIIPANRVFVETQQISGKVSKKDIILVAP